MPSKEEIKKNLLKKFGSKKQTGPIRNIKKRVRPKEQEATPEEEEYQSAEPIRENFSPSKKISKQKKNKKTSDGEEKLSKRATKKKSENTNDSLIPELAQKQQRQKELMKAQIEQSHDSREDTDEFMEDEFDDMQCCTWWQCFKYLVIAILCFAALAVLKLGQEDYAWGNKIRENSKKQNQGQELNFYEILELDSSATQSDVKKQFRKLSLRYHPDRNKGCKECPDLISEVNLAYETLGDEHKREIFDQTLGSFDTISSQAIELGESNYDELVLQSDKMWVIQVYAEWYPMVKSFSPVWEDIVQGMGDYVNFGRIHSSRESSTVRRIPAAVRTFPTVFSMMNGKLLNSYDLKRIPREMILDISKDFPNYVLDAAPGNIAKLKKKMHRRNKFVNALVLVSTKTNVNILLKSLALKYHGAMQVALCHPKVGTTGTRFLGQDLEKVFGLETVPRLPAVFIYSNGRADWIDKPVSKRTIEGIAKDFLAKRVPRFNQVLFSNICVGDTGMVCVLLLQNCVKDQYETASDEDNKKDLKHFKRTLAYNTMEDVVLNEDLLHPRRIQFGFANVRKHTFFQPFCANHLGQSQVIASFDGNERFTRAPNYEAMENLFQWLVYTFEGRSEYPIERAPEVQRTSTPSLSYYIQIREFIDDFNLKDHDNQVNIGIIVAVISGSIGAYWMGMKGLVMMIFGAGVFGGLIQQYFMMTALSKQNSGG